MIRTLFSIFLVLVSIQAFASDDFQCFSFKKDIWNSRDPEYRYSVYISDDMCEEYCSGVNVVARTESAQSVLDSLPGSGTICMKGGFNSRHTIFFAEEIQ